MRFQNKVAGLGIALLALSACSGPGFLGMKSKGDVHCTALAAPPYMLVPGNGATGVDPNIGTLKVDGGAITLTMVSANGQSVPVGALATVDLDQVATIPALAASMKYTLTATYQEPCGDDGPSSTTIGSFTTAP